MAETKHIASTKKKSTRVPGKHQPSGVLAKHALGYGRGKARHEENRKSLKQELRELLGRKAENDSDLALQAAAERWFSNKATNTRGVQQAIGRTRGRIKSGGGNKQVHKDTSGR